MGDGHDILVWELYKGLIKLCINSIFENTFVFAEVLGVEETFFGQI